ncbi:MAG: universal stress protein [Halobacteriales archaeon]|nr:universal stress protein [Halobacteriales archaeon]
MSSADEITVLIPVDISDSYSLPAAVLNLLSSAHVVVLGYYPVPSQTAPAQIKHQHESDAERKLEAVANQLSGHADRVTDVLVFTHDRNETVDRIANTHEADAVLTPGEVESVERILVPLRGGSNVENILSLVKTLLEPTDARVTLFHSADEDDAEGHGEDLLEEAVAYLVKGGVDPEPGGRTALDGEDTVADILTAGDGYDVLVIGETKPSLRDRILGRVPSKILTDTPKPVFVVRDTEGTDEDEE